MEKILAVTESYFDGERFHSKGPYAIAIEDGRIHSIEKAASTAVRSGFRTIYVPFVMPGLVESHCHVFLDGAELDAGIRKAYLGAPIEKMLETARKSVDQSFASGIMLLRDCGDVHGINSQISKECSERDSLTAQVLSPGKGIRKKGRYGGFFAVEVTDRDNLVETIRCFSATTKHLKIVLTGIIDFEKGEVKGEPQFDIDECKLIVKTARELGMLTYAHCSGVDGLNIAVDAGIDSIEHGFFMNKEILKSMADKGTAWVPTFSPVNFQYIRPELAGWNSTSVEQLGKILDNHYAHVAAAMEYGVPVVAGSDAGSYGVPHGVGLIDELFFFERAGMAIEKILSSATSLPRRLLNVESADIMAGNRAQLLLLDNSPLHDLKSIRHVRGSIQGEHVSEGAATRTTGPVSLVNAKCSERHVPSAVCV